MSLRGSCLCGAVGFEIDVPPGPAFHCHCSRCRKTRGVGHATNGVVPIDALRFVRGQDLLASYRPPDAKRFAHVFCKTCGATMPRHDQALGIGIVPMGSLDDSPEGFTMTAHIHVASKAAWETIADDGLPRFEAGPR